MSFSTYIVYFGLLFFVITVAFLSKRGFILSSNKTIEPQTAYIYLLPLVAISLAFVSGVRYEVGVDWRGYLEAYLSLRDTGFDRSLLERWEYGYLLLNQFFAVLGADHKWMFFTVALIGWVIYTRSIPLSLLPMALFFTFTSEIYFWSNNAVRQFVAASFFLFSLRYVAKKSIIKYTASLILGSLFHVSVLLLWPLYFLLGRMPLNKFLVPAAVFVSFVVGQLNIYGFALQWMEDNLQGLASMLGYGHYLAVLSYTSEVDLDLGLGFYWIVLTNLIVAVVGTHFNKRDDFSRILLTAFVIGAVLFNLFYASQLMGRVFIYLIFLKPVLLAYCIALMSNSNIGISFKFGLVLCYVFIFVAAIERSSHQCCPYQWSL